MCVSLVKGGILLNFRIHLVGFTHMDCMSHRMIVMKVILVCASAKRRKGDAGGGTRYVGNRVRNKMGGGSSRGCCEICTANVYSKPTLLNIVLYFKIS